MMEISPAHFTPMKRRAVKCKEQLDEEFLRRSKRNAAKCSGFKTPQKKKLSRKKKKKTQEDEAQKDDVLEPNPWP